MNRLLASTLEILNVALAAGIILVSLSVVSGIAAAAGVTPILSLTIGGVVGVVIAGVICGLIAMITLIESHLRVIAEGQQLGSNPIPRRREPTIRIDD